MALASDPALPRLLADTRHCLQEKHDGRRLLVRRQGHEIIGINLPHIVGQPIQRAAAGYATDLPDLEEEWGLGTLGSTFYNRISPFYSYNGVNSHAGLSYFASDWLTPTAYALEMEEGTMLENPQQLTLHRGADEAEEG